MKTSFAKFNNGKVSFEGSLDKNNNMFEDPEFSKHAIKEYLLTTFNEKSISLKSLIEECIDKCDFLENKITQTLKILEKEEKIIIERFPPTTKTGKPRTKIDYNDLITFPKTHQF